MSGIAGGTIVKSVKVVQHCIEFFISLLNDKIDEILFNVDTFHAATLNVVKKCFNDFKMTRM